MPPENLSIVKTLVERADEIPTTRAGRDRRKKHVFKDGLGTETTNCPLFMVYDYHDATVLLGKLGTDLAHDVGN